METILFLSHTEQDGTLSRASLEALAAARGLADGTKGQLVVGVFGEQTAPAAAQLAGSGAKRALAVTSADLAAARYASDARDRVPSCSVWLRKRMVSMVSPTPSRSTRPARPRWRPGSCP